jgi:hypothetical protein
MRSEAMHNEDERRCAMALLIQVHSKYGTTSVVAIREILR